MLSSPLPAPRLVVVGDVHAESARLARVLDHAEEHGAEGVLLVGDLACAGWKLRRTPDRLDRYRAEVAGLLRQVRERGLPLRWVPGNHDLPEQADGDNLDGRVEALLGLRIGGLGGAGPARFGFAYEWSEAEAATRLEELDEHALLLAHCPPRDTPLDRTHRGQHVGSRAVAEHVAARTEAMVCGHIHEAPGVHRLGDCLCLNAGGLGAPHGRTQAGWIEGTQRISWCDLDEPGGPRWTWLSRSGEEGVGPAPPWA